MIYANVRAANKGPLPDIELTHIYERIIDVMRALQRDELASERNAQAADAGPRHWRNDWSGRARDREQAMIVAMQEKATEEQIDAVIDAMVEAGVNVHRTTGATQTILAGVGPTAGLDLNKFELLPGVLSRPPHQRALQAGRPRLSPEGTVVEFPNGAKIGGEQVAVIAGPCAIENREQIFAIAACVKAAGAGFLRGGAFKPRSSPYAFQGLGIPGLQLMHEAAQAHGLLTVSEVMEIAQIEPMLPYVDCFQVGARNMQNFNLLRELGQVRKPVLLKRGIAATIEELLLSSEYILSGGNYDGAQRLAKKARGRAERGEHRAEAQYEKQRGQEYIAPRLGSALAGEVFERDAGDEGEVRRHQRQNTGREKRQQPRRRRRRKSHVRRHSSPSP